MSVDSAAVRRLLVLALLPLVFGAATAHGDVVRLVGTVGPGFTITLKQGTKSVKTLRAGSYTIKVTDKGDIHNFHLIGPGVNKKTGVSSTSAQTWTVKLRAGKYTFQCDPHATSGMRGTFKVTS
jgi:plastocyanin